MAPLKESASGGRVDFLCEELTAGGNDVFGNTVFRLLG